MDKKIVELVQQIRSASPLIHNITNFVVMNSSANILLALGASPVMAHSPDEVEEMAAMAGALVINIGTLEKDWIGAMIRAGRAANAAGAPVVLDPVGAGATAFRNHAVERIMGGCDVSVVRGNVSEIMSLASPDVKTRGVESALDLSEDAVSVFRDLAAAHQCIIAVSGKKDCITDGIRAFLVENGHPVMARVTGIGCGLSAVTGAFCAMAGKNLVEAVAAAFSFYGRCGELAGAVSDKPGTFYPAFLDCLYCADAAEISPGVRIREK